MVAQCQVSVKFVDGLPVEEIVDKIGHLKNPQVVVWYIGAYGLRKAGAEFYREALINPVLQENEGAMFWLVDLTAWGAFKHREHSVHKASCCCEAIDKLANHQIRCVKTGEIFKKMQAISDGEVIDYFKAALRRGFVHHSSRDFPNKGILVREVFKGDCPVMEEWFDHDVGKCYSVFQYLEACLLIEEIFLQKKVRDLRVVFALPNDELKYYWDEEGAFQKDVAFLISRQCRALKWHHVDVKIKFLTFNYGIHKNQRPYNAPGKVIKRKDLAVKDIIGHVEVKPKVSIKHHHGALKVKIETRRLYLVSYEDDDFEKCVSLYGNEAITQLFDYGKAKTREEVAEMAAQKGKKYFNAGEPFGLFSIFSKKGNVFMGQVDLVPAKGSGVAEIGGILDEPYQGRGYYTEAIRAIMVYYVNELNRRGYLCHGKPIKKVVATVHPENTASKKAHIKVGMHLEKEEVRFGKPRLWYVYYPESAFFAKLKKAGT
jgi:RimJ/RimL family protein N-acetyltransferase